MTDQTPPEEPTSAFEALLADPLEQFDKRTEILASIDAYSKAVPSTASAQTPQPYKAVLYTASEVKVLTETASKVAYALGRKDAGEEIAAELVKAGEERSKDRHHKDQELRDHGSTRYAAYLDAATIARNIASQPPDSASDATSGVPGHPEVSEAVRSPQEPCEDPDCPIVLMHTHPWLNGGN